MVRVKRVWIIVRDWMQRRACPGGRRQYAGGVSIIWMRYSFTHFTQSMTGIAGPPTRLQSPPSKPGTAMDNGQIENIAFFPTDTQSFRAFLKLYFLSLRMDKMGRKLTYFLFSLLLLLLLFINYLLVGGCIRLLFGCCLLCNMSFLYIML